MTSPSCPPVALPGEGGLYGPWLEACGAAVEGAAGLLGASLGRWPRPFDVGRWLDLMAERRPPGWATPHELVFEAPLARLRDHSIPGGRRGLVPTLVLPPQAGHDSCIVDFSAEQSQMRTIRESGLRRAFTLDWCGATAATADSTIEDYLDVIDRAVEHCGGRVNLIGDCQGGWLATIYAAQAPERVNTLTIAGAPIDFTAGRPVIGSVLNALTPGGDMAFYEWLVAAGGGVLRGRHMLNGFIMIGPGAEISRQLALLVHVEEPAHVDRYREFEDWFKHTQDVPGAFYLWIVRHLFRDNELIAGELEVRGERIDLGRLAMPLNLLAGATDHITPPSQVYALADHAASAPEDVMRRLSSGGHLGLFMGHEALGEQWPPLLAAVLERSLPKRRSAPSGK